MSAAEVSRMKATLRFLREHRNTLKLKVNAAEDLLLNGRREPTHRGLCQHLLSKLDRSRVLQAAAHMPPAQATEFLGGIVRFKPEVPYLIEFLRSVKTSAHPRQAAAALTQALELLDFAETSAAQMRDLLQLVVDVFPKSELPVFMFSLLSGAAFRAAFDRSSEVWPASLTELLLPLRSLHRSLIFGRGRRGGGPRRDAHGGERLSQEQIRAGALLMLGASRESLQELPEALRRQLVSAGSDALGRVQPPAAEVVGAALVGLFGGLEFRDPGERTAAARALAGALLRAGFEAGARALLQSEASATGEAGSAGSFAGEWLNLLAGPRLGNLVFESRSRRPQRRRHRNGPAEELESSGSPTGGAFPSDRWLRAFHLPTQREVLVRVADPAASGVLQQHAELRRRVLVPGVAPVLEQGSAKPSATSPALAYLALLWQGPPLSRRVQDADEVELVLGWCAEACRLLAALGAQGLTLPDASLARFSVDESQRLWLVDLWGLAEGAATGQGPLELARGLCRELLAAQERDVLSAASAHALDSARSFPELLAALG
ncbi:MAG: hypothetical protein RL685_1255 [Pseudomonadota bacterium]|jgi:hypothetical protein